MSWFNKATTFVIGALAGLCLLLLAGVLAALPFAAALAVLLLTVKWLW